MHPLDSGMALHAGLSEIIGRGAGSRIIMGKDEVVVMAIITGGSDNETPLE
jgi:DNA integrity scanning protein DisA with diadenylate cyclase activity